MSTFRVAVLRTIMLRVTSTLRNNVKSDAVCIVFPFFRSVPVFCDFYKKSLIESHQCTCNRPWFTPLFFLYRKRSISVGLDMSDKEVDKGKDGPGEKGFRTPGLRGAQTTTLFRAVNPELFIKPNKPVMAFGLVAITLCVGYLGYLHANKENDQQLYEAIDSQGERYMKRKTSKWD